MNQTIQHFAANVTKLKIIQKAVNFGEHVAKLTYDLDIVAINTSDALRTLRSQIIVHVLEVSTLVSNAVQCTYCNQVNRSNSVNSCIFSNNISGSWYSS